MNQQDKDRLRELAQKATPGPWEANDQSDPQVTVTAERQYVCNTLHGNDEANGNYIASANPAVILSLLEENEALDAKLNDLQTMYRAFRRDYDRYNDGDKSMPFHELRSSLDALIEEHEHAMQHKGD